MTFFKNSYLKYPFIVVISGLVLAGCKPKPADLPDEERPLFRRGIVSLMGDELKFQACYVNKDELISDHTGKLKKRFARTAAPVFYAELTGDHMVPGEPWQVHQVHLMGGNQSTCGYELSDNEYRAAGNDPLWIADIREDGLYVQDYGKLSQLIFPRKQPMRSGSGFEWHGQLEGTESFSVTLTLEKRWCRDQFDIDYEYSSRMTLNGKVFTGCARQGNLEKRTLPGLYTSLLAGANGLDRFVSLDLASDKTAILTQDYRNSQPLILQKGTWKHLSKGKILVHLTEIDGREDNELLIFQRDKRGGLVVKGYSSTYGSKGLRLERAGPERVHRRFNR